VTLHTSGCSQLQLALDKDPVTHIGVVSSGLYPVVLAARISFGITID
jgi:hypothetical protein